MARPAQMGLRDHPWRRLSPLSGNCFSLEHFCLEGLPRSCESNSCPSGVPATLDSFSAEKLSAVSATCREAVTLNASEAKIRGRRRQAIPRGLKRGAYCKR